MACNLLVLLLRSSISWRTIKSIKGEIHLDQVRRWIIDKYFAYAGFPLVVKLASGPLEKYTSNHSKLLSRQQTLGLS